MFDLAAVGVGHAGSSDNFRLQQRRGACRDSRYCRAINPPCKLHFKDRDDVLETYRNPNYRLWFEVVLPELRKVPVAELVKLTGLGERQVRRIRNGARPKKQLRSVLLRCMATGR